MEPETEYLYEAKIEELKDKIKQLKEILKKILDGRTIHKEEIERAINYDIQR